jgi:hypothetical protein
VLGSADGPSSLAMSMFTVMELLEGRIDTVAANEVHWGSHSVLVAAVSHFLVLKAKLEVLGSRRWILKPFLNTLNFAFTA